MASAFVTLVRALTLTLLVKADIAPRFSEAARSDALLQKLKTSAGVYNDHLYNPLLKKTVLITGCNHGYVQFLANFECFMNRLNLKVLVMAMDAKTHAHIESNQNSSLKSFLWVGRDDVAERAASFRSPQFNIITHSKTTYTRTILSLGYDVLFIDLDIIVLRDPVPYLLWRNVDYVFTHNMRCPFQKNWNFYKSREEGNTGFYYVKSNNKTIQVWASAEQIVPLYPGVDDQTVFWKQLRNASSSVRILPMKSCGHYEPNNSSSVHPHSSYPIEELVICPLDGCKFSASSFIKKWHEWLIDNLILQNETAVALHANYQLGAAKKMRDIQDRGYWISSGDGQCKNFTPPI